MVATGVLLWAGNSEVSASGSSVTNESFEIQEVAALFPKPSLAELEDLQTIADAKGISIESAIVRYSWNDDFTFLAKIRSMATSPLSPPGRSIASEGTVAPPIKNCAASRHRFHPQRHESSHDHPAKHCGSTSRPGDGLAGSNRTGAPVQTSRPQCQSTRPVSRS